MPFYARVTVLVRILAFDGKHKLSDKCGEDIYIVEAQPNRDIPVYEIVKESDRRCRKVLHHNHMLPIGSLPAEAQVCRDNERRLTQIANLHQSSRNSNLNQHLAAKNPRRHRRAINLQFKRLIVTEKNRKKSM